MRSPAIENENIGSYPGYSFDEVFGEVPEDRTMRNLFLGAVLVIILATLFFYILFDVDLPVVRP